VTGEGVKGTAVPVTSNAVSRVELDPAASFSENVALKSPRGEALTVEGVSVNEGEKKSCNVPVPSSALHLICWSAKGNEQLAVLVYVLSNVPPVEPLTVMLTEVMLFVAAT
jgi:hypothetical protein